MKDGIITATETASIGAATITILGVRIGVISTVSERRLESVSRRDTATIVGAVHMTVKTVGGKKTEVEPNLEIRREILTTVTMIDRSRDREAIQSIAWG